MWHRCEQPVGHPLGMAPAQPGWTGWPCASGSCLSHAELLSPRRSLVVGRHCTPAEPSPAGHSGEVKSCGSAPWEPSLHSSHEHQHFR